jgi:hypothetical protein
MEAEAEPEAEPAAALLLLLPSAATLCGATAGMCGSCARRALRSELCSAEGMPGIAGRARGRGVPGCWRGGGLQSRERLPVAGWGRGARCWTRGHKVLRATRRAELGEQRRGATAEARRRRKPAGATPDGGGCWCGGGEALVLA